MKLRTTILSVLLAYFLLGCDSNLQIGKEDMIMVMNGSASYSDKMAQKVTKYFRNQFGMVGSTHSSFGIYEEMKAIQAIRISIHDLINDLRKELKDSYFVDYEPKAFMQVILITEDKRLKLHQFTQKLMKAIETSSTAFNTGFYPGSIKDGPKGLIQEYFSNPAPLFLLISLLDQYQLTIDDICSEAFRKLSQQVEEIDPRVRAGIQYKVDIMPELSKLQEGDTLKAKIIDLVYYRIKNDSVEFEFQNKMLPIVDGIARLEFEGTHHQLSPRREMLTIKTDWLLPQPYGAPRKDILEKIVEILPAYPCDQ